MFPRHPGLEGKEVQKLKKFSTKKILDAKNLGTKNTSKSVSGVCAARISGRPPAKSVESTIKSL